MGKNHPNYGRIVKNHYVSSPNFIEEAGFLRNDIYRNNLVVI